MTNKEKKICTTTQTACGSSDCRTFFPDGKFQEPVEKRSLLLHSCCGPCSTAVVERLAEEFNVTVFFYNPCITDQEEYLRRRSAQIQFLEKFNEENIVCTLRVDDCADAGIGKQRHDFRFRTAPAG